MPPATTRVEFRLPHSSCEPLELKVKTPALAMAVVDRQAISRLDEKWNGAIGVYVLLGPAADGTHEYLAYVGKSGTGGLKERLMTHRSSPTWEKPHELPKEWWKRALIVRSRDEDGFNSAEAGWLEGRLWETLARAPAAKLVGRKGEDKTLPKDQRDELDQFVPPIMAVLRAIGAPPDTPDQEVKQKKIKKYGAGISDLIDAGLLAPGTRLRSLPSTHEAIAVVQADGRLEVNGVLYEKPSTAAVAVVGYEMNGWNFWGASSGDGTRVPLAELRKQLEPAPTSAVRPPVQRDAASSIGDVKIERKEKPKKSGGLKTLLDAGLLQPGAILYGTHKKEQHKATVDAEGRIHLGDGSIHATPSSASVHIVGYETNGWMFWITEVEGTPVRLKELQTRTMP
jgi:hypothetical protein